MEIVFVLMTLYCIILGLGLIFSKDDEDNNNIDMDYLEDY